MSKLSRLDRLGLIAMTAVETTDIYDVPKRSNYEQSISDKYVTDNDYHKKGLHCWKINGKYQVFAKTERDARKRAGNKGFTPVQTIEMID